MRSVRDRPKAAVVLAVVLALSCGETRHVCKTRVTDRTHGTAVDAVGVGPSEVDARDDGRLAACRDLGRLSPEAEALVGQCDAWRLEQERQLPTQEEQIRIWHVCSWGSMDFDDVPFEPPADDSRRRINDAATKWRARLRELRDAYVATCTTDDDRFAASHDCVEKGPLHDLASGCAAPH